MNGLRHTDGCEITVALVGKYYIVGQSALHTGRNCGSASVRRLYHIAVEVVVSHYRAADGSYSDRPALDSELVDRLGYETVNYPVCAARAVMKRDIRKCLRFVEYDHLSSPPLYAAFMASRT